MMKTPTSSTSTCHIRVFRKPELSKIEILRLQENINHLTIWHLTILISHSVIKFLKCFTIMLIIFHWNAKTRILQTSVTQNCQKSKCYVKKVLLLRLKLFSLIISLSYFRSRYKREIEYVGKLGWQGNCEI